MSTKALKQQLNSVLRRSIDKQQGDSGGTQKLDSKRGSKPKSRRSKRAARKGLAAEEKQTAVLASNLKYYAKTTSSTGKAQDLIAQLLAKQGFQPRTRKQAGEQQQQQRAEEEDFDDLEDFADLM